MFKAKYLLGADQIVRALVDAHISSNEETIFGDWLEGLAIFVNTRVFGGRKSGITGVDLEFDQQGRRYIGDQVWPKLGKQLANSQNDLRF